MAPQANGSSEGEDLRAMLKVEADSLASYHIISTQDSSAQQKIQEACLLCCLAEEKLEVKDAEQALHLGSQALQFFRDADCLSGQQDALRLLCGAEQTPDAGMEKAQAELSAARESRDLRGQGSMLLALAEAQLAKALTSEALSSLDEALSLLRGVGDLRLQSLCSLVASRAHLRRCQYKEAILAAEAALVASHEAADKVCEGQACSSLALAHLDAGNAAEALSAATSATNIFRELKSPKLEVGALLLLSRVYIFKEQPRLALRHAQQSLALCRQIKGYLPAQCTSVRAVVNALIELGEMKRALNTAEEALAVSEKEQNKRAEASLRLTLAFVRRERHELDLAVSEQKQAIDLLKEVGDRHGQLDALLQLSAMSSLRKKASEAVEAAEQAQTLAQELQDRRAEAAAKCAMVLPKVLSQKPDDALTAADESREAFQEMGDRQGEIMSLVAAGSVMTSKRDFAAALGRLSEAKSLSAEVGDKRGIVSALLQIADVNVLKEALDDAIEAAEEARELCRETRHRKGLANCLKKLATAYVAKQDFSQALKCGLEAKKCCKEIEDQSGEAAVLHLLAAVSISKSDHFGKTFEALEAKKQSESPLAIEAARNLRRGAKEAVERARDALEIAKKTSHPYSQAASLTLIAHGYAMLGRFKEAMRLCRDTEDIFRDCGAIGEQAQSVCLLAEIYNVQDGQKGKALEFANRSLELARRAEDGEAEARAIHTLQAIQGAPKQQYQVPDELMYQEEDPTAAAASAAAAAAPKGLDPDIVQAKLTHVVEQVTGAGEEVHLDTPLMESGLDSLSAVAFRNELSRVFDGIGNLPAALMFDYPNVRAITQHIVDRSRGLA